MINTCTGATGWGLLLRHPCEDILLGTTRLLSPAATFLQVEGPGSGNIKIDRGDLSKAAGH
jgi:hypothetical protein